MNLDFTKFIQALNNEFKNEIGLTVKYVRSNVTNSKLQILMQYYLDDLCIDELEFVVTENGAAVKSFIYNNITGCGKHEHSYQVVLKDETKPISISNIQGIDVIMLF